MKLDMRQSTTFFLATTPEHSVADNEDMLQQETEWQAQNPQEKSRSSDEGLLDGIALEYSESDFEITGKYTTSPRHAFSHIEQTLPIPR